MKNNRWMDEVRRRAQTDEWYQVWRQDVDTLRPAFGAILDCLTEQQQTDLNDYICACECMRDALLPIAYALGQEHGNQK